MPPFPPQKKPKKSKSRLPRKEKGTPHVPPVVKPKPKPKPESEAQNAMMPMRKARHGMTMKEEKEHVVSVKERRAKRQKRHNGKKKG
jgi:hypothetical protein